MYYNIHGGLCDRDYMVAGYISINFNFNNGRVLLPSHGVEDSIKLVNCGTFVFFFSLWVTGNHEYIPFDVIITSPLPNYS